MSYIKRYFEEISIEIGEEGSITPRVLVEAKKQINNRITKKLQMPDLDEDIYVASFGK